MIRLTVLLCILVLPLQIIMPSHEPDRDDLAGLLRGHVAVLASDSLEGRGLGTEGKIIAKNYIADHFRAFGLKPYGDDYFHHFDLRIGLARVPGTNVVGYLPGNDPLLRDEFIVIGAHYDHLGYEYRNGERVIFPGADDNASGTAVLIELARIFTDTPGIHGRSLIFIAFDAEESGLLGAERFISENDYFDMEKVVKMFSLDMVGMYEANRGLQLRGIGSLDGGTGIADRLAAEHGISLQKMSAEIEARTDTRPFGNIGIPSTQAFTGLKSPYHKPEDRYDLLDYDGMAGITLYLQSLITELSIAPELGPSRRFARMMRPWGLRLHSGVLANLGSSYNSYPDEFFQAKSVFAFSAGLFMQVQFGEKFSLQPEILYDFNGSKSPAGTYRRHSVTVPLNLHLYLAGDPGGFVKAYPIAGAYYRFNFAGSEGGVDLDFENLHPADEWGINLGFGMEVLRVRVSYTWRRGLTDISPVDGTEFFNTGGYFTIGYRF